MFEKIHKNLDKIAFLSIAIDIITKRYEGI